MTKQERTPGPWGNEEGVVFVDHREPVCCGRGAENGGCCGNVDVTGPYHEVAHSSPANAAHIVHCVNTYDELVGALEALVIFDEGALESKRPDIFARQMNRAIAALKLAKGGNGE